jgi:hypothetical protein
LDLISVRPAVLQPSILSEEIIAHEQLIEAMGEKSVWRKYSVMP